ncbi:MAG: putative lipid II flippase FtsW [Alphaproteobacteria bacterium]|nr:putative lipid II flippase FtsW [Alphaproteobacteria bacterium]
MFFSFSRSSRNIIANWWWTVDKWLLAAVAFLFVSGIVLSLSASPAVAVSHGRGAYHFVVKHCFFLCLSGGILLLLSLQGLKWTRRIALLGYVAALILVFLTLFFGIEINGAKRWINVGLQIQPSEFLKPTFIVFTAWLFEMQRRYKNFLGFWISLGFCGLTSLLLLKQPDFGMTSVVVSVWLAQLFLAGVPLIRFIILGLVLSVLAVVAYLLLPHVQVRIGQMLDGMLKGDPSYQVKRSLEAFKNGGWFGVGVGEGVVKWHIPDAHTDFIFPVAAEEYGMIFCLLIVAAYALIVIRSMMLSSRDDNMFIVLSVCGLAISFGLQAFVNMASTLQLGPTKGMALPLISYGGSSLLGASIGIGMLLALTRKNIHAENKDEES